MTRIEAIRRVVDALFVARTSLDDGADILHALEISKADYDASLALPARSMQDQLEQLETGR